MASINKSPVDLGVAASLPPKEAISYFESKGYTISWNWYETLEAAHARAFTVAKCTNLDVLNTIRASVDSALKSGMTEQQFIDQLTPTLQKLGWWGKQTVVDSSGTAQTVQLGSPRRLATIYQTNTRTAYASGRYAQMMNNAADFPYWQYVAVMDSHTRLTHGELNLMVFRYDDPFWQTHYPPNDWECRCRVRTMSEGRYQASGINVTDSTGMLSTKTVDAGTDPFTGEVYQTTVTTFNNGSVSMTPGAGWSYNVGAAAFGTDAAACRKLIETPDADLRRQFIQTLNNAPARRLDFSVFVNKVIASQAITGALQAVGFVTDDVASAVRAKTGQPPARMAVINDNQINSALMPASDSSPAMTAADLSKLPAVMANPTTVLLDTQTGDVLYCGAGEKARPVAVVPFSEAGKDSLQDVAIGARMLTPDTLESAVASGQYEIIQGDL